MGGGSGTPHVTLLRDIQGSHSMSLSITCSNCQKNLKVKEELAGKKVRCPDCSGAISVPAKSAAAEDDFSDDRDEAASPRRKRRVVQDEDEFEDMPVIKPRAKTSKKKSSQRKSNGKLWLWIGGSCAVGLLAIFVGSLLVGTFKAYNEARQAKGARAAELQLAEKDRVQADIRSILNAGYSGDLDTILRFTNPKLVEMMGGKDQAKVVLAAPLAQIQSAGISIESLNFPQDPTFFETRANQYVIVHTLMVANLGNGQRAESVGYQLGVRPLGTTEWTYVDGKGLTKANAVTTILPDFPRGQSLPPTSLKRL